ncbi:MAG: TOBE domain-containing protein [Clostridia bacterium]|nr:TOBE domain-containing protein [Clostridia bacterium]
MQLSARNQFSGTVTNVSSGAVNGIVTIDVKGTPVTATISNGSIRGLGLKVGTPATAVIKATEVMIGKGELILSARNKFKGTISRVEKGAVNSMVTLETAAFDVVATISNAAVDELELEEGVEAVAVVKATSVMVLC